MNTTRGTGHSVCFADPLEVQPIYNSSKVAAGCMLDGGSWVVVDGTGVHMGPGAVPRRGVARGVGLPR